MKKRRRVCAPLEYCSADDLVLRQGGIDLVGPGENAAGEVRHVGEAGLLES